MLHQKGAWLITFLLNLCSKCEAIRERVMLCCIFTKPGDKVLHRSRQALLRRHKIKSRFNKKDFREQEGSTTFHVNPLECVNHHHMGEYCNSKNSALDQLFSPIENLFRRIFGMRA